MGSLRVRHDLVTEQQHIIPTFPPSFWDCAMWEIWVQSLCWEDPLEKRKATHSSILAWRIQGLKESDLTEWLSLMEIKRKDKTPQGWQMSPWRTHSLFHAAGAARVGVCMEWLSTTAACSSDDSESWQLSQLFQQGPSGHFVRRPSCATARNPPHGELLPLSSGIICEL